MTRDRGGEASAGLKKFYYICFEKLFLRPCSNVKRISGTSNTVGHLITYKRSNSAQLNRIFAVFVIVVNVLDEAALFIDCLYKNSITTKDEDAEFPSKLEFSLNGTPIAMEFAAHFVDSQPPVTESNKIFYPGIDEYTMFL